MMNTQGPDQEKTLGPRTTRLGLYLRRIREHRGLSIRRLAAISGVSESVISRLETGMTRTAHDGNLESLSRALQVPVAALKDLGQRPVAPPPVELLPLLERALGEETSTSSPSAHEPQRSPDSVKTLLHLLHDDDGTIRRRAALLLEALVEKRGQLRDQIGREADQQLRQALAEELNPHVRMKVRVKIENDNLRIDEVFEGVSEEEIARKMRDALLRRTSFATRLAIRALSDSALWAKVVETHNSRFGCSELPPRTAKEFLEFGARAGYVTFLER